MGVVLAGVVGPSMVATMHTVVAVRCHRHAGLILENRRGRTALPDYTTTGGLVGQGMAWWLRAVVVHGHAVLVGRGMVAS